MLLKATVGKILTNTNTRFFLMKYKKTEKKMQPVLTDWRLTSPLLRGNCSNGKHGSVSCRCTTRPAALLDCGGKVCNITTWMSEPDS